MMNKAAVVELERTVRFSLAGDGTLDTAAPQDNTHAGWPPMRGFGRYYEMHVTCVGPIDPVTGYFVNIKLIDTAVREAGLPRIAEAACRGDQPSAPLMARVFSAVNERLGQTMKRMALQLTPTLSVAMEADDMTRLLTCQRYEFSAAHRLHAAELDDAENQRIFGKCNNPSGHGHNYRLDVTVRATGDAMVPAAALDALVDRVIVERFDHKHLNIDTEDFQTVNPSVEHIARICFELLAGEVGRIGAELAEVKVWETEKTVCTYRG